MATSPQFVVRVPAVEHARIVQAARKAGVTPSEWIRRTLYRSLHLPARAATLPTGAAAHETRRNGTEQP